MQIRPDPITIIMIDFYSGIQEGAFQAIDAAKKTLYIMTATALMTRSLVQAGFLGSIIGVTIFGAKCLEQICNSETTIVKKIGIWIISVAITKLATMLFPKFLDLILRLDTEQYIDLLSEFHHDTLTKNWNWTIFK